jgi:hypothetical protein
VVITPVSPYTDMSCQQSLFLRKIKIKLQIFSQTNTGHTDEQLRT